MPPVIAAVLLGLAAFTIYNFVFAGPSFVMQGGSKFWPPSTASALKGKLSQLRATPHPTVERTWMLGPAGPESALDRVRAIQAAGSFAVTTDNLLGGAGAGPMGLSQVLASEVTTLAPASGGVAVLPAIV